MRLWDKSTHALDISRPAPTTPASQNLFWSSSPMRLILDELIKKGFHPFGTPYFVPKNAHGVLIDYAVCQAMVSTGDSIKTGQANQPKVEVETEQVKMAKQAAKALDDQIAKALS